MLEVAASAAPHFGANVVGHLSVPSFGENFDQEAGKLINAELNAQLGMLVGELVSD